MNKVAENELSKLYYTIGEVAEMFDVNTSLIRFWEKEFPQISPKKNKKGNRLFSQKDISIFNKIYHLVKEQGFTLEGAKKALKSKTQVEFVQEVDATKDNDQIIEKLEKIKQQLEQMRSKK